MTISMGMKENKNEGNFHPGTGHKCPEKLEL
jgi:hypothetical protein